MSDFFISTEDISYIVPEDTPDLTLIAFFDDGDIVIRARLNSAVAVLSAEIGINGVMTLLNPSTDGSNFFNYRLPNTAIDDSFVFNITFHKTGGGTYVTQTINFLEAIFANFTQTITKVNDTEIDVEFLPIGQSDVFSHVHLVYSKFQGTIIALPMQYDSNTGKFMVTFSDYTLDLTDTVVPLPYAQYRFSVQHDNILIQSERFNYIDPSFVPEFEVTDQLVYDPPSFQINFKPLNFMPVDIKVEFNSAMYDMVQIGNKFIAHVPAAPDLEYTYRIQYKITDSFLVTSDRSGTFPPNFTSNLGDIMSNFSTGGPDSGDPDVILDGGTPNNNPDAPIIDGGN